MRILLLLALVAAAAALPKTPNWVLDFGPASSDETVIHVALKQRNLNRLSEIVKEVSDPDLPTYGKHYSISQLADVVAPPDAAIDSVVTWLKAAGASEIHLSRSRDVIRCHLSVAAVEDTFGVRLSGYRHAADPSRRIFRSEASYSLPTHIEPLVDLVHGISNFPMPSNRRRTQVVEPKPVASGTPKTASNLQVLARGGSTVQATFVPICGNGEPATTVPACMPDGDPLVSVKWVATGVYGTVSVPVVSGTDDAPDCVVTAAETVTCSSSFVVPYYDVREIAVTLSFKATGDGPATDSNFGVVATPPVTPQTLARQYSIPPSYIASNGTQCVVEFEQQYYSPADLQLFFEQEGLPAAPVTVIGPNNASVPGGEANLDIQYIMGVAPGIPTTFWSIRANSTAEIDDILTWAYAVGNMSSPPLVNSLSYGMTETQVDKYQGSGYLARSDVEFQKLAARGLTVIIADGDTGAGDLGQPPMSAPNCAVLHADWPSQSPYVTAIGSTYLTPNAEPVCYTSINCDNQPLGEVAVSMDSGLFWTTGGGMSVFTDRPDYQNDVVTAYLKNATGALPPSSMFNAAGRAYPDAVSVGHNLMVVLAGATIPVDGTSASAPIFAGVVSLLNDARLAAGKTPLGFLNPLMYKLAATVPGAFYDVTVGQNRCGSIDYEPYCCEAAYKASVGWDAVTGLGSPNFAVLKEAVLALP